MKSYINKQLTAVIILHWLRKSGIIFILVAAVVHSEVCSLLIFKADKSKWLDIKVI